ncbi:MAG TPA: hypothetical protein VFC21_04665 [Bryobacteraceae bacterium]|nr:hypothetical protein [Bryobacteraceae bacterium]
MLKRLWFLLSTLWALTFPIAGATRLTRVQGMDWAVAAAPLVLGWFLAKAARFVVAGTPVKRKYRVY